MKRQDKEFQEAFVNIAEEIKAIKAKVQPLNWETNPELKQAAERLGIFDKEPGPIKSTDSYLYNRYLENLRQGFLFKYYSC